MSWNTEPDPKRGFCLRVGKLTFYNILYLALWGCVIYYNASVTMEDGEEIPLREVIPIFIRSPAWTERKDSLARLFNYFRNHGWKRIWEDVVETLHSVREHNAFKVLGLDPGATQEEITYAYRKRSRRWTQAHRKISKGRKKLKNILWRSRKLTRDCHQSRLRDLSKFNSQAKH
ncbi:uncharacterized protein [Haliotis cracherodii]|uniref:uncharacterized protein n=1 Tax=Haliotis cracherodii TaxID=6455 RepID=UPI0039E8D676